MIAPSNITAAGLKLAAFAKACSISRTLLYQLPEELKPRTVRFGRAVVVVEPPAEWLARVAEIQKSAPPAEANDSAPAERGAAHVKQQRGEKGRSQAHPRAAVAA